jgi:hypothetical protein
LTSPSAVEKRLAGMTFHVSRLEIVNGLPIGMGWCGAQLAGVCWSSQRSASSAAMQPKPAEVIAWR